MLHAPPIHTENNKLGCTEHIKKDKRERERRTAKERRRERRTWSEVSEGCLQRPLVMSWSVLSSSWSFGTERNVFFCPYLAKSWPAILGPRPLKMRHKWPVWATLSFTPTGERSRKKKWCNDAGFNRRLTSKRKRERRKGKRKGWVDERNKESERGDNLLHGLQAGHSLLWTPPSRHLLIPLYLRKDKKKSF